MTKVLLLVEDDVTEEKLAIRAFEKSGIATEIVVAPLEYLFATEKGEQPDTSILPAVVMLDLNLPRMDGLEVLQKIRANERTRCLPVVILAASVENKDIASSYSPGPMPMKQRVADLAVDEVLEKPVQLKELLQVVERYCG